MGSLDFPVRTLCCSHKRVSSPNARPVNYRKNRQWLAILSSCNACSCSTASRKPDTTRCEEKPKELFVFAFTSVDADGGGGL